MSLNVQVRLNDNGAFVASDGVLSITGLGCTPLAAFRDYTTSLCDWLYWVEESTLEHEKKHRETLEVQLLKKDAK